MYLIQYTEGDRPLLTAEVRLSTQHAASGYMQFQIIDILKQDAFEDIRIGDSLYVYCSSELDTKRPAKGRLIAWAAAAHEKEWKMETAMGTLTITWIPTNLRQMMARKRDIVRSITELEGELRQLNMCIKAFEEIPYQ
jgi:hypothetical protein